ncbi:MAG: ribosome-associated translation inhibitor RaiA [Verrucomicrobiaceae bacterium]|nr:MAG: ribosome-associated translation inhibitor RaiA [Verrucomicrobiaceae bacterium]
MPNRRVEIDQAVNIQSSNIDLGEALTWHARQKVENLGAKFFGRITSAYVHFRKEGETTVCSIRFKVGGLKPFAGDMMHVNPYRAFNYALDKVEKQLRRMKRELREDKPVRKDKYANIAAAMTAPPPAPTSIIQADDEYDLASMEGADNYVKALMQAAKQDQSRHADPDDIKNFRTAAE